MPRQADFLKEVETRVRALPVDPGYKAFSKTIAKTDLPYLAVCLPDLQRLVREGFSFYELSDKEILEVWNRIWRTTNLHDVMTLPLGSPRHSPRNTSEYSEVGSSGSKTGRMPTNSVSSFRCSTKYTQHSWNQHFDNGTARATPGSVERQSCRRSTMQAKNEHLPRGKSSCLSSSRSSRTKISMSKKAWVGNYVKRTTCGQVRSSDFWRHTSSSSRRSRSRTRQRSSRCLINYGLN